MKILISLEDFLKEENRLFEKYNNLDYVLNSVVNSIQKISALVDRSTLNGLSGKLDIVNIQGEKQTHLDVLTNDILIGDLKDNINIAGIVSEEIKEPMCFKRKDFKNNYLVIFDPLDGSSNIDNNITIGSIFSIIQAPHKKIIKEDFLVKGRNQILSGYAIYGASTMIVLALEGCVNGFTLDKDKNQFLLTHPSLRIPNDTNEFAINMSNMRYWDSPIKSYINDCTKGSDGIRKKKFNMRWVGSMVADVHRILIRGGIYLYPRDDRKEYPQGRLRLMYEINPIGWIIENAGGKCSTGFDNFLDNKPHNIHQRAFIIAGSKNEVEIVEKYYQTFKMSEEEKI